MFFDVDVDRHYRTVFNYVRLALLLRSEFRQRTQIKSGYSVPPRCIRRSAAWTLGQKYKVRLPNLIVGILPARRNVNHVRRDRCTRRRHSSSSMNGLGPDSLSVPKDELLLFSIFFIIYWIAFVLIETISMIQNANRFLMF
jgi:hypothetical protein